MSPGRSKDQPPPDSEPAISSSTPEDQPPPESEPAISSSTPKPSKTSWKTEEQTEYILSHYSGYITYQASGSLNRFWPIVYDGWYKEWPITPTPAMAREHGSPAKALLALRTENNRVSTTTKTTPVPLTICTLDQKIRAWFHNRARLTSKTSKSGLRLHKAEKRKLAPAQAYCTYAWDSGLKEIVTTRWEQENQLPSDAEEGGLTTESAEASTSNTIPIDFKVKIAKEIYEALPPDKKRNVLNRIEDDHRKTYQPIRHISDPAEKDKKLSAHEKSDISLLYLAPFLTVVSS